MGFADDETNQELLRMHGGDVNRVIDSVLRR
jgi:hypothetical protein